MDRQRLMTCCLVTSLVSAVVLAVVTVIGIVTGAGLPPVFTGCMAIASLCASLRVAVGGDR